jgi:hypothetical protein
LGLAAVVVALQLPGGGVARAQYYYPPGYGAWGWNGWGGGGGSTVQGNVAQGLGAFAAGAGVYNQETAVARSINADTAMRWNQYLWMSQQEANKRYHEKLARERRGNTQARDEIYQRLRNNPEPGDVDRGDALNVALDEVLNPAIYLRGLKGAGTKVPGALIRDIPFQKASAAITASVDQLTKGGPPESLKTEAFAADRAELRGLAAQLRSQNEQTGKFDPATVQKAQDVIHRVREKVEKTIPQGTRQRTEAERYLKALFGLTRLLDTPAMDVLLAGVEKRPDTTLGDLLTFMSAFNLRFGVASSPRQKQVYRELYPLLVQLRNEAAASKPTAVAADPGSAVQPSEFFAGIPIEHLDPKDGKIPAPPQPGVK